MMVHYGKGIAHAVLALSLLLPAVAQAQEEAAEEDVGLTAGASLDLVTDYVWRGFELSNQPGLQPSVWANYGSWEVGTWGSHAMHGDSFHEQDLWVTYYLPEVTLGSFAVTLNDYYENSEFGKDFFNFSGVSDCPAGEDGVGDPPRCATGSHTLEVAGSFSAAAAPVALMVAYNVHNDPQSAVYSEASFTPTLAGFDFGFTAGGVLGRSDAYYGTSKAEFTNLGAAVGRSLELGHFTIPLSAQIVRNPGVGQTYYVLSAGISTGL